MATDDLGSAGSIAPPAPTLVADGVWSIGVPIPTRTPPYTLAYALLGDDGVHLVDPGWDSPGNRQRLVEGLSAVGASIGDVRSVVATHHHPDHLGLAPFLRETAGSRILLGRVEREVLAGAADPRRLDPAFHLEALRRWGVPEHRRGELAAIAAAAPASIVDVEPDQLLDDGDELDLGGHRLRVVATPGHTDGHLCFVDEPRGLLYTGDQVLPRINPGVGLGALEASDPLRSDLDSLRRLGAFDDLLVLPGHEAPFRGLRARRRQLAEHRLRRTREAVALRDELGDAPVWAWASRMTWTGGWDALAGFPLYAALGQTQRHVDLVRSGHAEALIAAHDADAD